MVNTSSLNLLTVLYYIGNANIVIVVIECNIPLLMNSNSMKKAKIVCNFNNDTIHYIILRGAKNYKLLLMLSTDADII